MYARLEQQYPSLTPLLKEAADISQILWQKGWAERNAGNFSVRLPAMAAGVPCEKCPVFSLSASFSGLAGISFLITGSGKRMRDLMHDPRSHTLVIQVADTGDRYSILSHTSDTVGSLQPTSEILTHLTLHQYLINNSPQQKVVFHTHPNEVIALTHIPHLCFGESLNQLIWGMHPESVVFLPRGVGFIPYLVTGSLALGQASLTAIKSHDVIIWEKHGCLAVGETLSDAFDKVDLVSKSADIYLKCRMAGCEPQGLTPAQIQSLITPM